MSSFLVSDETINNIITGLTSKGWTECLMWKYPFKDIIKEDEDFNKFGKELLRLNYKALSEKYNDKLPKEIEYKFKFRNSSIIQFLKNLQCFLYQCTEGEAVNEQLYKDLRKVEDAFKDKIINDLEEYNKAEWGF